MKTIIKRSAYTLLFFLFVSSNHVYGFNGPDTFADLAEEVSPAVVNISTTGVSEQSQARIPSIEDFFKEGNISPKFEDIESSLFSLTTCATIGFFPFL